MKIDIYTSSENGRKFLSVAKGTTLESLDFPSDLDPQLLSLSPFRTRLELDADQPHKSLDEKDILQQIEQHGYAVHGAKNEVNITL